MAPYRAAVRSWVMVFWTLLALSSGCIGADRDAVYSTPPPVRASNNALARSGFDHFYSQEFDQAIREFQTLVDQHSNDPFPNNYLLAAVTVKELHRIGALETEMYMGNNFLESKPRVPLDFEVRKQTQSLAARSEALANAQLAQNPNNVDALYARAVARSMRSAYIALGEKSWMAALRAAQAARHDAERVLQLDPTYVDAKLAVGVDNYLIGCLNWPTRFALSLMGMSGNRQKGLQYIRDLSEMNSSASVDAKIVLALFLARERRYEEAIPVVRGLTGEYPRSFLFALEYGNLLNAAGKAPEAVVQYRTILERNTKGYYQVSEQDLACWGLGAALRKQRIFGEAAAAFDKAASIASGKNSDMKYRAMLAAGEMYDTMSDRQSALARYQTVAAAGGAYAEVARRRVKTAYKYP